MKTDKTNEQTIKAATRPQIKETNRRAGRGNERGGMLRVKINWLAGLILHNSAEFLSFVFKAAFASSVQCGGASSPPSSLLSSAQCQVRID